MSASKHETDLAAAFQKAGYLPPDERLEIAARKVATDERDPEKRPQALLDMLKHHPDALLELARPVLLARAGEYMRSVAMQMAAERGGRHHGAEQAGSGAPPRNPSPEGAHAGQGSRAEQASDCSPACDTSAPADGREGRGAGAEQASHALPSRPLGARPVRHVPPKPPTVPPDVKKVVLERLAKSKLDTFLLNGWPIGDLTPLGVRSGILAIDRRVDQLSKERQFAERLAAGVPDTMKIRECIKDDEADRIYREVFDA